MSPSPIPLYPHQHRHLEADTPAITLIRPSGVGMRVCPVIISSPHSGRAYPKSFLATTRLSLAELRQVEDALLDIIVREASLPAPQLFAEFPRSYVDVNRPPHALDASMFTTPHHGLAFRPCPYTQSGFGVIPRKAKHGKAIYDGALPGFEARHRLTYYYRRFHTTLRQCIADASKYNSEVVLLDMHSMPSDIQGCDADIVLGDGNGTTASMPLMTCLGQTVARHGLRPQHNTPFAGGYITRHYGKPHAGVSAIQIEINRRLYLDEYTLRLKSNWRQVAHLIADMTTAIMCHLSQSRTRAAS
ncbi:MAG: N-formylglutamate amidohydrolase [Proteobacteria bacterium]|nr:N-formylglutamate amidohydrolase [Pseudomonadota bacterium]